VSDLFKFERTQKIFRIGNAKVGGQPGELPTILIGNIFYKGMPEVTNHKEGEFDQERVLKWIIRAEELSEKTGVPHLIDIMAMYPEAMKKYISFVIEHSENAIFIDGANSETRIAGLKTVKELGLQKEVIFNALFPKMLKEELDAVHESRIDAAVLLAQNEMDYSPEGRITALKGFDGQTGLLKIAKEVGIKRILVDTIVFDVPSIAYAAEAVRIVKNELGYPAGCSPANATYDWKLSQSSLIKEGFAASNASAHTFVQFSGADFLIYGPIKQAKNLIPACAVGDAIIAYHAMRRLGIKPLVSSHPIYKIF
jgi:tetrahydromethanopterin S-methyltransferase subunit H